MFRGTGRGGWESHNYEDETRFGDDSMVEWTVPDRMRRKCVRLDLERRGPRALHSTRPFYDLASSSPSVSASSAQRTSQDLFSRPARPADLVRMNAAMDSSKRPRRTNDSWINLPIQYGSGSLAGQTIRAELTEIQKADLGRKYARVDRRPLDPPPVVLLRLYQVFNYGTEAAYEKEIQDYSEVNTLGLVCNVDLFPVPNAVRDPSTSHPHPPPPPPPHVSQSAFETARPYNLHSNLASIQLPPLMVPNRPVIPQIPPHPTPGQRVITYFGDEPITEDMNCTTALSGATFIQLATIEYQGRRVLVFPFADLAVKIEGQFFLRYRCFDIFSRASGYGDLPIQAECFGGPFRIYSTKEFPGLRPSTELTKQLARWGVRLNTRETERKRKRKEDDRSSGSVARSSIAHANKESDSDED